MPSTSSRYHIDHCGAWALSTKSAATGDAEGRQSGSGSEAERASAGESRAADGGGVQIQNQKLTRKGVIVDRRCTDGSLPRPGVVRGQSLRFKFKF
jgi:hypothetical protein